MIILDQRAVVVDGPQLGAGQSAWFVTDPDSVRWAQQMFTASWQMGHALPTALNCATPASTARQPKVIAYLLQGLSDLEISRRLDVSLRTVAYDVRGITDAVDASGPGRPGLQTAQP